MIELDLIEKMAYTCIYIWIKGLHLPLKKIKLTVNERIKKKKKTCIFQLWK